MPDPLDFDITCPDFDLTEGIRTHTHDRLFAALDQHAGRGVQVAVKLRDLNGPRGGVDKSCEARVRIGGIDDITVTKTSDDLYRAISETAEAVKRAAGRAVNRTKPGHRERSGG